MGYCIELKCFENAAQKLFVPDIASDELVTVGEFLLHIQKTAQVAGISEQIEIDDFNVFPRVKNMPYEIAADESAAPCNQNHHL